MNKSKLVLYIIFTAALVVSGFAAGFMGKARLAQGAESLAVIEAQAPSSGSDPLVLMYSAKFVCTEAVPAGMYLYTTTAPIVSQKTEVLIHNPNDFTVTLYRKAVRASFTNAAPYNPGAWQSYSLQPDHSIKIDCDDVTKLLTSTDTTFLDTFGLGVTVEGFVVVGIGPQQVGGVARYVNLDVTAEYARSSEVLKKDVNLQPWWTYWWGWTIPWGLGHPYQRILPIPPVDNIDCREALTGALYLDAQEISDQDQEDETIEALSNGQMYNPMWVHNTGQESLHALVPLIGRCDKIDTTTMSVDYVLFSNKGPTDFNPITLVPEISVSHPYPWSPGHWYDVPVVMPQNVSTDLDVFYHTWFSQRWVDLDVQEANDIDAAMEHFAPYWSQWGYWYWWWNGGDSVDIGVGEGESLDVEQITPVRVIMTTWPPP